MFFIAVFIVLVVCVLILVMIKDLNYDPLKKITESKEDLKKIKLLILFIRNEAEVDLIIGNKPYFIHGGEEYECLVNLTKVYIKKLKSIHKNMMIRNEEGFYDNHLYSITKVLAFFEKIEEGDFVRSCPFEKFKATMDALDFLLKVRQNES